MLLRAPAGAADCIVLEWMSLKGLLGWPLSVVLIHCENRISCSPKVKSANGDATLKGVEPARRDSLSALMKQQVNRLAF